MKKLAVVFLSVNLLCSAIYADDDSVVATYSGGKVTESQVLEQFKQALDTQPANKGKKFSELDANIQEALVRGYINVQLLTQEAKALKIDSTKEFLDKLETVKTQMIQQELIERKVKDIVTDAAIEAEYKKFAQSLDGQNEFKISHILVDTKEKALEVKKKLNKGGKFAALVKEYSKDEGSKANGGEIGYVVKGQLVPEFETVAFAMKVNEISEPVKTQFGWHIILLNAKRPAQVPPLESEKANIQAKLTREAVEKYFTELSSKADVKLSLPVKAPAPKVEDTKKVEDAKPVDAAK